MSKKLMVAAVALATAIGSALPASAADFSVSLNGASNFDPAGATVSINVANVPEGQGIYFMLCEGTTGTPRPANCSTEHQAWLTTAASSLRMGATMLLPVNEFKVAANFAARDGSRINCLTGNCGVFVRRDHFGTADISLDRFFPITFSAAPAAVAQSSAKIGTFNGRVAVRVTGAAGKNVAVQIGGRWVTRAITSDSQLVSWRAGNGNVNVRVFIDRQEVSSARLNVR
jgi:hypothetical protein